MARALTPLSITFFFCGLVSEVLWPHASVLRNSLLILAMAFALLYVCQPLEWEEKRGKNAQH